MSGRSSRRLRPLSPVEQARLQGTFIQAREEDRLFEHAGGSLYYAIDSNVVEFLVDPVNNAIANYKGDQRRSGFAAIFADDPEEPAQVLAQALADYLIEELSPSAPLLIPTPLDSQVIAWQRALTAAVAQEIESVGRMPKGGDKRELAARAADLSQQLSFNADLTPENERIVAQLMQLSLLRRATKSLERLRGLLERRRIAVAATEREMLQEPLRRALAIDINNPRQRLMNLILASQWHQVLSKLAPGRIGERRFDQKINALARIEQWNLRLQDTSKADTTKLPARIVFVTGDSLLFEPLPPGRENQTENDRENGKFRAKHLRHPRSFLSLLPMLQNSSRPTSKIEDESVEGDEAPEPTGSHFLDLWASWKPAAPEDQQSAIANEIKHHWHNLLKAAVLRYELDAPKAEEFDDWQLLAVGAVRDWQKALDEKILKHVSEFWEQCFYFATQGLVIFGQSADYLPNSRNAPPIFLESWTFTARFIDNLLSWTTADRFDIAVYKDGISSLGREFEEQEGSRHRRDYEYAYYLAHAALFAGRGDWLIAAKVASHARARVHQTDFAPGEGNGREALYLEAFSLRHAAQTLDDLVHLEALVIRAEAIGKSEQIFARDRGQPAKDCIPIRFAAERLAIRLSKYWFKRSQSGGLEPATDSESLGSLAREVVRLLDEVERQSDAATRAATEADATRDGERRAQVLLKLHIRVLLNALGLALYSRSESVITPEQERLFLYKAVTVGNALKAALPEAGGRVFSPFGEIVLLCAKARTAVSLDDRNSAKKELLDRLADDKLRRLATFPYDVGEHGRLNAMRASTLSTI